MADYQARIAELGVEVTQMRARAVEAERAGGPPAPLATYLRLSAGIEASYAAMRDRAFADGLALVRREPGATAESQQRRWSDHFNARASDAFRQLKDLASRDDDTLRRPFEVFAMQESMGFAAIASMPVARAVGQISEHLRTLEEQTGVLHGKWSDVSGLEERMDGQIAGLRVQVLEIFKRAVSDVRSFSNKIEEVVRQAIELWDRKEETSPDPSLAPLARSLIDTLGSLHRTLDESAQQAQTLYGSEETVHQMFGQARAQVREFLERVNKDTVGKMYADTCRAAQDAAAGSPRPGQVADARLYAERVIAAAQPSIGDFNAAWDKFYTTFNGTFTGDVSEQTVELLADQELFNQFWKDVEGLNLPGEITTAASSLTRLESISLDRLTPTQRQMFEVEIRARLREIQDKIRSMDSSIWERFKLLFVLTPVALAVKRLKELPGFRK